MRGRRLIVVALVLGLVGASTASAEWRAAGSLEPSTVQDRERGMMFPSADASAGPSQVYFNGFQTIEGTTVNPNVGATGSRVLTPGPAHQRAMLGIWKDCNADGHVGIAESALLEYRTELLLDDEACPVGSAHNDGRWVSEMIGIGMVDPCEYATSEVRAAECNDLPGFHANEHVLYANGTRVWADVGVPGSPPPGECPIAPPPGTTSGTGLLLAYLACQEGRRVETAIVAAGVDRELLALPFPVTPFGGPDAPGVLQHGGGAPSATVWDCAQPRQTAVAEPTGELGALVIADPTGGRLTGEQAALPVVGKQTIFADEDGNAATPGTRTIPIADDGDLAWAPAVAPSLNDPTASWWDATEAALDGPRGDCDGESALRPYALGPLVESGAPIVEEGRKDRASFSFTFYDGHRGLNENIDFVLGPTTPSDAGLLYMRHGRGGAGPLWSADAASANEPQLLTRGTLAPTGALFWTYYATLGSAALSSGSRLPSDAIGIYGSEACGDNVDGVHGGWVCDASAWWRDALGNDARPRYLQGMPYAPLPGDLYHMLDVDCYDGYVAAGSVFASGALLAEGAC